MRRVIVTGTFSLTDVTGRDVTPKTIAYAQFAQRIGATGQLQASSSNQLAAVFAPGDYTLVLEIPGHPRILRDLTVTRRSRSEVAVRPQ